MEGRAYKIKDQLDSVKIAPLKWRELIILLFLSPDDRDILLLSFRSR